MNRKVIGLSIGIAAAETGMHPQTLREYERQGLVAPHRTQGGARRYRDLELQRLRRIQQLTEQGLSLAGVRYVLELEDQLRTATGRVRELEERLQRYEPLPPAGTTEPASESAAPVKRSLSLEIVHIPRARRTPRWRNYDD